MTFFCEKWVAILNKCSADLMLLLINSETIESLKGDLEKTHTSLKDNFTVDE